MKVSRVQAIATGLLTIWPILYMIFFFSVTISCVVGAPNVMDSVFPILFILHVITLLVMMALLVYYSIHLFKSEEIDSNQKILWALFLFMGNMLTFPFFWYLHIWRGVKNSVDLQENV